LRGPKNGEQLKAHRRTSGFTLIELLVVIVVIGLLIALLLPAVQSAREVSRRLHCANNLKQMGLAIASYHQAHNVIPPGFVVGLDSATPGWGWGFYLLPQLEQQVAYNSANVDLPIFFPGNRTVYTHTVGTFLCPSSPDMGRFDPGYLGSRMVGTADPAISQYVGSLGAIQASVQLPVGGTPLKGDGVFFQNSSISYSDVTDGTSQTFFVGERSRNVSDSIWAGVITTSGLHCTKSSWPVKSCYGNVFLVLGRTGGVEPADQGHIGDINDHLLNSRKAGPDGFWSLHSQGSNFLMGDGSVRFIKQSIVPAVFIGLASRAKGEIFSSDQY
jgi:prepilin-type N-terminal cleavage/methylation domain-containing protein/prepilin-type processing-associated H-X9-DG protein